VNIEVNINHKGSAVEWEQCWGVRYAYVTDCEVGGTGTTAFHGYTMFEPIPVMELSHLDKLEALILSRLPPERRVRRVTVTNFQWVWCDRPPKDAQ
jgi:hypothetical protein